ncbi:glycosyltransferase family 9 protein [Pseudomonadota bacterium]
MTLPLVSPANSICILRLSALGDICHTLPVVRTIQKHWPETKLTWVIGKLEYQMVGDIPGIEFIVFDKSQGKRAYFELRRKLKKRRFDILLHMQMSIRSSLASLLIPAKIRLGFDRDRAKDMQWLFTNHKIAAKTHQHVVDSFFCFSEAIGIKEHEPVWDIPLPNDAQTYADNVIDSTKKTLVISPCSSMSYRNWTAEGYAEVADYAKNALDMQVLISGGPSPIEKEYGEKITALSQSQPLNLVGKTNIKQLFAILAKADVIIAPDSGPAHFGTAVGTPVIGLYACTNPDRARPYLDAELVVSKYPDAIKDKHGKEVAELPWGTRVRDEGTMERITPGDVITKLDALFG